MAFLWLILGYHLQQSELKQNTDALNLQAKELKNTVEQQRQLVSIEEGRTQADIKRAKPDIKYVGEPTVILDNSGGRSKLIGTIANHGAEAKNIAIQILTKPDESKNGENYVYFKEKVQERLETLLDVVKFPETIHVDIIYHDVYGNKYTKQQILKPRDLSNPHRLAFLDYFIVDVEDSNHT